MGQDSDPEENKENRCFRQHRHCHTVISEVTTTISNKSRNRNLYRFVQTTCSSDIYVANISSDANEEIQSDRKVFIYLFRRRKQIN